MATLTQYPLIDFIPSYQWNSNYIISQLILLILFFFNMATLTQFTLIDFIPSSKSTHLAFLVLVN